MVSNINSGVKVSPSNKLHS